MINIQQIEQILKIIEKLGQTIVIEPGATIFRHGDLCANYLLVIKGVVKVFTRSDSGREILLYRVGEGESCTLTTTCLLADNSYPAEGITESRVEAIMISASDFKRQLNQSDKFREFVFASYGRRLRDIISLVESVSFGRLDARLANWLVAAHHHPDKLIAVTHQEIATELGTAREVISRKLKEFEAKGWLKLSRGLIEIIELDKISAYENRTD